MENKQSVLPPMENLTKSYSSKFLEHVEELGSILPVNDETFYLILDPHNNRAAKISYQGKDSINIDSMTVKDYNFLSIETDDEIKETKCNEGAILWILKSLAD